VGAQGPGGLVPPDAASGYATVTRHQALAGGEGTGMSGPATGGRLLGLLEPGWRRHLVTGEPAGTLDVAPEVLGAAATALGELSRAEPPRVLARRWPACLVVAVAQVTAHHAKDGKVWPAWHRAAGVRAGKHSTANWAEAFLASLAALGLSALDGDPQQTVLAHAAVTTPCLPEFLRLAGAGAPERELAELDPAVAALLHLPAGASFVERCRALMKRITGEDDPANGHYGEPGNGHGREPSGARGGEPISVRSEPSGQSGEPRAVNLAALALPGRIVAAARAAAATPPGLGTAVPARLDPFGRGVLTCDAAIGDGAAVTGPWTAMSPDEISGWPDPLLAFDAEGHPIAAELPPEPVWLVHPADRPLHADSALRMLMESRLPLRWNGWRLVQVDLSAVAWLELAPGGEATPRRRPVRGRAKPRLVPGIPVPGVSTKSGLPIFGTLPTVLLPASEIRWLVEMRRLGSSQALAVAETDGNHWNTERLWERAPRPVLGELVVTATALGNASAPGLRRVVAVAEGLAASYAPALRLPREGGLEAAEAILIPAGGMTVAPGAAVLAAGVTAIDVACVAGGAMLPLRITPPHWRVRIEPEPGSGGTATAWHSLGPLRLETADLIRGGALRLDLPAVTGDLPIDVVAADEVVQVLEPFRRGGYPLRRMLDTVTAHGGAELRISLGARTAVIAAITATAPVTDPWLPATGAA
jgi:hypothetical protein